MSTARLAARWPSVTDNGETLPAPDLTPRKARGRRQSQIRDQLGMSDRLLEEKIGIPRQTIAKVLRGDETVRPKKFDEVERLILALDEEMGGPREKAEPSREDAVEFRISGNFGVDVVVRGPVSDMSEIEAAVTRLIREMRD